jgi:phospholipase C
MMPIEHVVVLMLENRSFDSMLGQLYTQRPDFDGLTGEENNVWHKPDGTTDTIYVWNQPVLDAQAVCIPDPDPGELFTDIHMQIHGISNGANGPDMSGFVDNYMRQPATSPAPDPRAVMHYFKPEQVPVISQLAKAFGVSDRWHASAPCQTWPNRFFAHCCTAGGYVNNSPAHFPYLMPTIFNRLDDKKLDWRVYFHDIPQAATLSALWWDAITHFRLFGEFVNDAANGRLPPYSFIEPRYFADIDNTLLPNDEHPPHNVAYGEQLIATVYNALRAGPGWKQTLLIITCDEHGGCYDHVPPPPATSPDALTPDGFDFGYYGVRVPAVIVSPYIKPGSIIRPATGTAPFDHTSISATLHQLFGTAFLTRRDAAAPHLLTALTATPDNDGPAKIVAPAPPVTAAAVAASAAKPPNGLQSSLTAAAAALPTMGADVAAHVARLAAAPPAQPTHDAVADASGFVTASMTAFIGTAGGGG